METNESKGSKIDINELKKAQEALRKEQGIDVKIDTRYKRQSVEEAVTNNNQVSDKDTTSAVSQTTNSTDSSKPKVQGQEGGVKAVSKEEILRQMRMSQAPQSQNNVNTTSNSDTVQTSSANSVTENAKNEESIQSDNLVQVSENNSSSIQDLNTESKNVKRDRNGVPLPPESALNDDLTSENFKPSQISSNYEEEYEDYQGLTDEEIEERKERKRRLKALRETYNSDRNNQPGDAGEYKKILDFSINTSIKRFRLKPRKKPIIIAAIIAFFVMVGAGVGAYFMLNKPPEPVVIQSIRLSQTKIVQREGEGLDIKGLYLTCKYSDGTQKVVDVKNDMISRTSTNISSDGTISKPLGNKTTFVYFAYEGFEAKLDIFVTDIIIESILVEVIDNNFISGTQINYDNILILAKAKEVYESSQIDRTIRILPEDVTFKINETTLTKTDTGIILPDNIEGEINLVIVLSASGQSFQTSIHLSVSLPSEEPSEAPEGSEATE